MSAPTPRTDAKLLTVAQRTSPTYLPEMVWADFARELERELSDQAARFHDEIVSRQGTVRANQELDLKERDQLRTALAAERARLDWLLEDNVTRFENSCFDRADIDAGMKEGAK